MSRKADFLIVGAGLFGACFARIATDAGRRCIVIDRRTHTGGNIHCENTGGITVHKYGPHIFHTSNRKVWDFVNSFISFNRFVNSPLAMARGKLYNLPFNMNTFHALWGVNTPAEAASEIDRQRAATASRMSGQGIKEPRNLEEQAIILAGTDIYEYFIKGYTEKQWGRPCRELPAFIIRRIPLRLTFDNNYFNDRYQGVPDTPDGYNTLTERLLDGSDVYLGTDFFDTPRKKWEESVSHIIYTGPVDQLYGFRFGPLEYRSVRFEEELLDIPDYQGNAVINFTDAGVPYTRIVEHKHFTNFGDDVRALPTTVITREYPTEWKPGEEALYPVNDHRNTSVYASYKTLAAKETALTVAGRLGEYRYNDMDRTIASAMALARDKFKLIP